MVMRWPWSPQPEHAVRTDDYTDKIVSEILARRAAPRRTLRALAATEAAVGMYERCIGSATVTPQNPLTAAVTPEVLTAGWPCAGQSPEMP